MNDNVFSIVFVLAVICALGFMGVVCWAIYTLVTSLVGG